MRFFFLVNNPLKIDASQTTAMLMFEAVEAGHDLVVSGIQDLSCNTHGIPHARARIMPPHSFASPGALLDTLIKTPEEMVSLASVDIIVIRINPGRGISPRVLSFALQLLKMCEARGITVVNSPGGLTRASSKLYILTFPEETRPVSHVSRSHEELWEFIKTLNSSAVIKPLIGTRGHMVFKISAEDKNVHQIIDAVLQHDTAMVQQYVPGASKGDTRVILINGRILEVNGKFAVVSRVPGQGDFRSNVHAGGTPAPAVLTPEMVTTLEAIEPQLVKDGLFLVGADMIGNKIIELNCFSTGGLFDASIYQQTPFAREILTQMQKYVPDKNLH